MLITDWIVNLAILVPWSAFFAAARQKHQILKLGDVWVQQLHHWQLLGRLSSLVLAKTYGRMHYRGKCFFDVDHDHVSEKALNQCHQQLHAQYLWLTCQEFVDDIQKDFYCCGWNPYSDRINSTYFNDVAKYPREQLYRGNLWSKRLEAAKMRCFIDFGSPKKLRWWIIISLLLAIYTFGSVLGHLLLLLCMWLYLEK